MTPITIHLNAIRNFSASSVLWRILVWTPTMSSKAARSNAVKSNTERTASSTGRSIAQVPPHTIVIRPISLTYFQATLAESVMCMNPNDGRTTIPRTQQTTVTNPRSKVLYSDYHPPHLLPGIHGHHPETAHLRPRPPRPPTKFRHHVGEMGKYRRIPKVQYQIHLLQRRDEPDYGPNDQPREEEYTGYKRVPEYMAWYLV